MRNCCYELSYNMMIFHISNVFPTFIISLSRGCKSLKSRRLIVEPQRILENPQGIQNFLIELEFHDKNPFHEDPQYLLGYPGIPREFSGVLRILRNPS